MRAVYLGKAKIMGQALMSGRILLDLHIKYVIPILNDDANESSAEMLLSMRKIATYLKKTCSYAKEESNQKIRRDLNLYCTKHISAVLKTTE